MKINDRSIALSERIQLLQSKQVFELYMLKEQFSLTYQSLRPINLIKSTFNEVTSSAEIKNNLKNNAIGLVIGFLSKKIWEGSSQNPIKKLVGTILEFTLANVVVKYLNSNKPTES